MEKEKLELHFPESGLNRLGARNRIVGFFGKIRYRRDLGQLCSVVLEMVLNIFDHAGGIGGVLVEVNDQVISFKVWDHGPGFNWDKCKILHHSTKVDSGINFGMGVTVIAESKTLFGIEVQITGSGTTYTGCHKCPRHDGD